MNKLLKSLLRTAVCMLDQYSEQVDRASDRVSGMVDRGRDRVSEMVDRGREAIYPENHELRNVLSFAVGVGVGIGAGLLLAPASGKETRSSIKEKVRSIRGQAS